MATKLPKHIVQMVEKNNIVMAIKTLAEEQNISMSEAKVTIDEYETKLKKQQQDNIDAIALKQGLLTSSQSSATPQSSDSNHRTTSTTEGLSNTDSKHCNDLKFKILNESLDNHLQKIGYKKPLVPYWVKRVSIIFLIVVVLVFVLKQLLPK